ARKSGSARVTEMDRSRKQKRVRFSQNEPGARRNQEAPHRSLGLLALRPAVQGKVPLFPFQKFRVAKPKRSLHLDESFRAAARAARSKHARERWHYCLGRHGSER